MQYQMFLNKAKRTPQTSLHLTFQSNIDTALSRPTLFRPNRLYLTNQSTLRSNLSTLVFNDTKCSINVSDCAVLIVVEWWRHFFHGSFDLLCHINVLMRGWSINFWYASTAFLGMCFSFPEQCHKVSWYLNIARLAWQRIFGSDVDHFTSRSTHLGHRMRPIALVLLRKIDILGTVCDQLH